MKKNISFQNFLAINPPQIPLDNQTQSCFHCEKFQNDILFVTYKQNPIRSDNQTLYALNLLDSTLRKFLIFSHDDEYISDVSLSPCSNKLAIILKSDGRKSTELYLSLIELNKKTSSVFSQKLNQNDINENKNHSQQQKIVYSEIKMLWFDSNTLLLLTDK